MPRVVEVRAGSSFGVRLRSSLKPLSPHLRRRRRGNNVPVTGKLPTLGCEAAAAQHDPKLRLPSPRPRARPSRRRPHARSDPVRSGPLARHAPRLPRLLPPWPLTRLPLEGPPPGPAWLRLARDRAPPLSPLSPRGWEEGGGALGSWRRPGARGQRPGDHTLLPSP